MAQRAMRRAEARHGRRPAANHVLSLDPQSRVWWYGWGSGWAAVGGLQLVVWLSGRDDADVVLVGVVGAGGGCGSTQHRRRPNRQCRLRTCTRPRPQRCGRLLQCGHAAPYALTEQMSGSCWTMSVVIALRQRGVTTDPDRRRSGADAPTSTPYLKPASMSDCSALLPDLAEGSIR